MFRYFISNENLTNCLVTLSLASIEHFNIPTKWGTVELISTTIDKILIQCVLLFYAYLYILNMIFALNINRLEHIFSKRIFFIYHKLYVLLTYFVHVNSLGGPQREPLHLTSVRSKPAELSLRILADFHLTFFGTQHPLERPLKSFFSISTVPQARLNPLHTLTLRMQALFVQTDREELHKAIARTGAVREGERGGGCARVAALHLPKLRGVEGPGWVGRWGLEDDAVVPGSIPGLRHTLPSLLLLLELVPRPAATTEHWLTTPRNIHTYTHTNCSPCVILHAALACRRDTLERVTRVRRLMHRYQVHASQGVDGGFPAPAPAPAPAPTPAPALAPPPAPTSSRVHARTLML